MQVNLRSRRHLRTFPRVADRAAIFFPVMDEFDEGNEHPPMVNDYNKQLAGPHIPQKCSPTVRTLMCYPLSHLYRLGLSTKGKKVSLDNMFPIIAVQPLRLHLR